VSSQKDTLLCAFGISHDLVWNCFIYSAAVVKPAIMKPNTCNPSILTVLTSRSVQPFSINSAELFAWGLPPKTGSFPHPRSAEFNILQDMCSCKYPKCSTLQLPAGQTICALNVSNSKLECVAVQPSVATGPSADAAQRPTRLAVLEARIMEDAAVEEALNCAGRIVPLEVQYFLHIVDSSPSISRWLKMLFQAEVCDSNAAFEGSFLTHGGLFGRGTQDPKTWWARQCSP
jgi:hypothetical protein